MNSAQPQPKPDPKPPEATGLVLTKNATVNAVMRRVEELQSEGRLRFPPNYSPANALISAYLTLQTTKTKDDKPALVACTQVSIANALLDMVVQGLTPARKQVYFIAYGLVLTCQRSYFGTACVTKRVTGATSVYAEVVYKDDVFETEIRGGNTFVTKHIRQLANVDKDQIRAAYCTIALPGSEPYTQVLTMDQIHEAWRKSKQKPFDEKGKLRADSVHAQFPEEMAKRTAINRTCKLLINSSDDSSLDLVIDHMNRADETAEEASLAAEVAEQGNSETIDAVVRDAEPRDPAAETAGDPKAPAPSAQGTLEPGW